MATKRTNYAKAQVWLTDMKLECEGTISAVCVSLFECIGDTAVRAKVLKVLQAQHEQMVKKAAETAMPTEPAPELVFGTEEWWAVLDEAKARIDKKVHELVNEETQGLSKQMDEELRQQLTEQFRFWRN